MEKYTPEVMETQTFTEPQDEYVCNKCGKIVGLLIEGECYTCSQKKN